MKVEFAKDEICDGVNSPYWIVMTVPIPKSEKAATALAAELNAREEKMADLQAERDLLRAYAECMKCWRDYCHQVNEDKSDWSKTLRGHGWNPSENGPIEFMDSLLTTALSAKGEINE